MKTKQEQSIIEEMARCMGEKNFLCADDCENCIQIPCKCKLVKQSKLLYKAGYRKATEVIDEFVERFKRRFFFMMATNMESSIYQCTGKEIEKLAAEMRQEVEK